MDTGSPLSIYLHLPFCRHKCSYCDFNAYAGLDDLQASYSAALVREIELVGTSAGARLPIHSVFFGGGTPSLTPLPQMAAIMAALRQHFSPTDDCEVTLEANPGTVARDYLRGLQALGINRLSLGVQSSHAAELALFERIHSFDEARQAVEDARAAGFDNLSVDLIYGIPRQTLAMWQATLNAVLAWQPDHLSLYALSLEFGTPLHARVDAGEVPRPDDDGAADMYLWADERLTEAGFAQYEISNWARHDPARDLRSRHNLQYWRMQPWLGFGAGAHGYAGGMRYSVVRSPRAYIERMTAGDRQTFPRSPAVNQTTPLDDDTLMGEVMMMGLRLTDRGVDAPAFERRFGVALGTRYAAEIDRLTRLGLLAWTADSAHLCLTPKGRLLGNQVFSAFV